MKITDHSNLNKEYLQKLGYKKLDDTFIVCTLEAYEYLESINAIECDVVYEIARRNEI